MNAVFLPDPNFRSGVLVAERNDVNRHDRRNSQSRPIPSSSLVRCIWFRLCWDTFPFHVVQSYANMVYDF